MAIPRVISDRAATIYSVIWLVGFATELAGKYFGKPAVKWIGFSLMAPFTLYVIFMTVLSTISFVRWVRGNRS